MSQVSYKVTNTTKQPGVKSGPHKNGFFVAVIKGRPMGPGRHVIVEKVTPGMLAMQRKGYVSISEVSDVKVEIKKEVDHVEKQNEAKRAEQEKALKANAAKKAKATKDAAQKEQEEAESLKKDSVIDSSFDKEAIKEAAKKSLNEENNAIVSGDGIEAGKDPLADVEEAISPDGEPNFVVTAGKKKKRK
jgi:hypothetical protein